MAASTLDQGKPGQLGLQLDTLDQGKQKPGLQSKAAAGVHLVHQQLKRLRFGLLACSCEGPTLLFLPVAQVALPCSGSTAAFIDEHRM